MLIKCQVVSMRVVEEATKSVYRGMFTVTVQLSVRVGTDIVE